MKSTDACKFMSVQLCIYISQKPIDEGEVI